MLGIKEYPTPTTVGMFDPLLAAPFAFVLTQSFSFLTKANSQSLAAASGQPDGKCRRFCGKPGGGTP